MGSEPAWSHKKQRVIGAFLMLPIVSVVPTMVTACHVGRGLRNQGAFLPDTLYGLWFIAGLIGALLGARLIGLSFERRRRERHP